MNDVFRAQVGAYEDYDSYILAYLNSYEILKESISIKKFTSVQVCFPALFTMHHVMELGLKMKIVHLSQFSGENYQYKLSNDLEALFEELKKSVESMFTYGKNLAGDNERTLEDQKMINEIYSNLEPAIVELRNYKSSSLEPFQNASGRNFSPTQEIRLDEVFNKFDKAVAEIMAFKDKLSKYTDYIDHIDTTYRRMYEGNY